MKLDFERNRQTLKIGSNLNHFILFLANGSTAIPQVTPVCSPALSLHTLFFGIIKNIPSEHKNLYSNKES